MEIAAGNWRGPLHGVPVVVKDDLCFTAGVRTMGGARVLGAEIVEVRLPDVDEYVAAWSVLCPAEAVAAHRHGMHPAL